MAGKECAVIAKRPHKNKIVDSWNGAKREITDMRLDFITYGSDQQKPIRQFV